MFAFYHEGRHLVHDKCARLDGFSAVYIALVFNFEIQFCVY